MTNTLTKDAVDNATDYEGFSFYNGQVKLEYSNALHVYTTFEDGERVLVPSVTSVLQILNKPALIQWAANMTVQYIREHLIDAVAGSFASIGFIYDDAKLEEILEKSRFNFRNISKEAKDVGHLAHEWLDGYLKSGAQLLSTGSASYPPFPDDPQAVNCIKAALDWIIKHNFKPLHSEMKVLSREYNYSGTFDWVGMVTSCGDPACCPFEGTRKALGDFKSSKTIYEEYYAQTAAYKFAYEEEFGEEIDLRIILRLGKDDGEFEARTRLNDTYEFDLAGYLGALQTYHWMQQFTIDKRLEKLELKAMKPKKMKKTPLKKAKIKEIAPIPISEAA